MVAKETINKVRDANIFDVVSPVVQLKKEGILFKGCCPFHGEKTPSFIVTPSKNIFKCFGCGEGGDAIHFVQKQFNKTFIEAVEYIALELNIPVEYEQQTDEDVQRLEKSKLYRVINNKVANFYHENLLANKDALDYCLSRFDLETIKSWKIGYASAKSELSRLSWMKEYRTEAHELGLLLMSEKDQTLFDFFRDRIMFPIIDDRNDVIGFSARIWKESQDGEAKYINSKNSALFNKSKTLFGLHKAAAPIRKQQAGILVEGNTDVIAMHQAECNTTIATCGTALTADHCTWLKRNCTTVIIMRDADKAGSNATQKDIELLTEHGLETKVVILPEGKDPFDFINSR